jgi:uncharacterized membrane protein
MDERLEATVLAGFLAFVPILTTVSLIGLASRAAKGRLRRNQWAGIRTPSTMESDQAWAAGHRAALRLTPWFLLTTVVGCAALFGSALYASSPGLVMVVGFGVSIVLLALLFWSAYVASKAAKSVDGQPDD